MRITLCFVAALLSGSAVADCPAGPYTTGSLCYKGCEGVNRCGDDNYVVCLISVIFYTAEHGSPRFRNGIAF